jgi:hypothetical protein
MWKNEFMMAAEALYAHTTGGYVPSEEVNRITKLWDENVMDERGDWDEYLFRRKDCRC